MRCPYCGGLNRDQSIYCVTCGRDMRTVEYRSMGAPTPGAQLPQKAGPPRPPVAQPQRAPGRLQRPSTQPPPANSRRQPAPTPQPSASAPWPVQQVIEPPEAPVPFPPTTIPQFEALLSEGAQAYTVLESQESVEKKKIVRIAYAACAPWQQAATLLKALREQQTAQFALVIIQGNLSNAPESYGYNNGQLEYARGVYLGANIMDRYIVETGNGFSSDSLRFVLHT